MTPMLLKLQEYLKNTNEEQKRLDWEEIKALGYTNSPSIKDFIKNFNVMEKITHSKQRELDVQKLCQKVMEASVIFWDNPNGAYENTCPFCGKTEYRGGSNSFASITEIKHEPDCAYLIAKDLSTNCL